MSKFTFVKHPDFGGDTEVTMTFDAELLSVLQENFQDFVAGAGFVVEGETEEEEEYEPRVFPFEVISNDDWMWDDDHMNDPTNLSFE